jgi:hypothetical protein
LAFTDSLVVKIPSTDLLEDFNRFVVRGEIAPPGTDPTVRLADDEEKNVETLLSKFPEFHSTIAQHAEHTHLLMVHKLQYQRLSMSNTIRIPQARFIFVRRKQFWFSNKIMPAIVQEKITGTPLLEMVERYISAIRPQYVGFLSIINPRLRQLIASDLCDHLNWFIANFLYDSNTDVLWYVDSKPSCLFGKRGNQANIQGLRNVFFPYC